MLSEVGQLLAPLILLGLLAALPAHAQPTASDAELRFFENAAKSFELGVHDRAEREFADFLRLFPGSSRRAEAILFQARSALGQGQLARAVDLLSTNMAAAGRLGEDYRYWLAESQFRSGNFLASADAFAALVKDFTNSVRLLEASYGEALARFRMQDWPRVVELLQRPDGVFQQAASLRANDPLVGRGALLLAEALVEQKQFRAAEQALAVVREADLIPEHKWRRQYLLCQAQQADGRPGAALAGATNLLALAAATGQPELLADSVAVQADLHEALGNLEAAAQVTSRNLAPAVPAEQRRRALFKIVQMLLRQGRTAEAAKQLEGYLAQNPGDRATDAAVLTLGELHLRQYLTTQTNTVAAALTNSLALALGHFENLITNNAPGVVLGKAHLNKGWCLWLQGKTRESLVAFRTATERLPYSEDQAVARFKLADALFAIQDYTNALQSYRAVLSGYPELPRVKQDLAELALYQVVRASLEIGDQAGATEALREVLKQFPASSLAERGLLLVSQDLTARGWPADARSLLVRFEERFPQSSLLAQAQLAVARTYVEEKNWAGALRTYEEWLTRFPTNDLRPRVEFDLAWASFQGRYETNAFVRFTNFLAHFPAHELAPRAHFWVADYYYRQGDFRNAERAYQELFQKSAWARNLLAYQARLMAARAAYARQEFGEAERYLTNLINLNDSNCPREIIAEAYFNLGDTFTRQTSSPGPALRKFSEAKEAFSRITQFYAESPLLPAAWGRIGDCYLQLATEDPKLYESAAEAYNEVLKAPKADVYLRSQAEVGLGLVIERQAQTRVAAEQAALTKSARDHYLNVFLGTNLREGEQSLAFWLKEAGVAAARLAEEAKEWQLAINIYDSLLKSVPALRPSLERKLERAREQARAQP